MHNRLEEIRTVSDAHGKTFVLIKVIRCTDDIESWERKISLKGVETHENLNLGDELEAFSSLHNFRNAR